MTQECDQATDGKNELPEGFHYWPLLRATLIVVTISAVYLFGLWMNFTEEGRRTLALEIPPAGADYLQMDVNVTHVDLLRSEMTTRITFHLAGKLAQDSNALTPATDLQLVVNTISGQQQFDFAKGQRVSPIEAVLPLEGNVNLYPFDRHMGVLWLYVTIPGVQQAASKPPTEATKNIVPQELTDSPSLPVSTSVLERRVQADTRTMFTASIPGLTFQGSRSVQSAEALKGLTGIELKLKRSQNVVAISIITMLMMAALSVGLLSMVLKIVGRSRNMADFLYPMSVALIFGLPALRNIQPDIPPPGTFGDSIVFTWAELSAAISAVGLMANWLFRRQSVSRPPAT